MVHTLDSIGIAVVVDVVVIKVAGEVASFEQEGSTTHSLSVAIGLSERGQLAREKKKKEEKKRINRMGMGSKAYAVAVPSTSLA